MAAPAGILGSWATSGRQHQKFDAQTLPKDRRALECLPKWLSSKFEGARKGGHGGDSSSFKPPSPDWLLPSPGE